VRVEGPKGGYGDAQPRDRVGEKKRASSPEHKTTLQPTSFAEELQSAVMEEVGEKVDFEELIKTVDECGRELLERPDARRLERYKAAIKRFVLAAIQKTYRVKVVEARGANPKLYVFIEKIEVKLAELTKTVLSSHRNPLRLLAQLEELRGLLLDLRT
jgi:uncharacterized protein YaaR (DUF327 family)